jgi:hypothetical protein
MAAQCTMKGKDAKSCQKGLTNQPKTASLIFFTGMG